MKRVLATILAIIYLTTSVGATVQLHYCMSDLVGWELSAKQSSSCSTCGMTKKGHKGCCHNEQKIIKIEKDQKNVEESSVILKAPLALIQTNYSVFPRVDLFNSIEENPVSNAPPHKYKVPVYLYNSVFRI